MARLQNLLAAMIFSTAALATSQGGPCQESTSCFTYTTTVPYTKLRSCPLQTVCLVHPHCLVLEVSTVTVPAPNKLRPTTPTVRITGPLTCPTCHTGCLTRLETVTTALAA